MSNVKTISLRSKAIRLTGLPQKIFEDTVLSAFFELQVPIQNGGNVYYGDSGVNSTDPYPYIPSGANGSVSIASYPMHSAIHPQFDLSKHYVLGTNGDTVIVTYQAMDDMF